MRSSLIRILWPAFGLVLVLALAPAVFAHAKLLRSQPSANASLKQAPKQVELWFSEELEGQLSTIIVTDQNGKRVDKNDVGVADGNKKLQISLDDLGAGIYVVEWKALSTDQHTMNGKFTFTIVLAESSAATTPPSQPRQSAQSNAPVALPQTKAPATLPTSESVQESGSSWFQSLARWFQYLAMMLLFGGFAFHVLVLRPALRKAHGLNAVARAVVRNAGAQRVVLAAWFSLVVLALASIAELVLQTSIIFDKGIGEAATPSLLSQVITKTGFGASWLLQAGTTAALLIIVFSMSRRFRKKPAAEHTAILWTGLIAAAVLLWAPTWTGHAAAAAKEYPFAKTTDWLHLAAAGVWVGGLFHLALTMPKAVSTLKSQDRLRVLHRVIPLFTRLAIVSTILIVLTGVYNSLMHVDRFGALWSTGYGETLLVKVLLVIPMLLLGGVNTFVIHPRASRLIANENAAVESSAALDRNFLRSVRIEALLGVAVLFVASILVFQQPARQHSENESPQHPTSRPMNNK